MSEKLEWLTLAWGGTIVEVAILTWDDYRVVFTLANGMSVTLSVDEFARRRALALAEAR